MGDDEYNPSKEKYGKDIKSRLGLGPNPLDGTSGRTAKAQYMFQYFLKVVSTQFQTLGGETINSNQYSATHFERDLTDAQGGVDHGVTVQHGVQGLPGAFFNFEISPILVVHAETRQSFAHFLTSTCAIVGGVLTVTSLLDGALFAATRSLKKGGVSSSNAGGKLM